MNKTPIQPYKAGSARHGCASEAKRRLPAIRGRAPHFIRSYGDLVIEPVDGAGGLDEVRAIPFDAAKIVRPHHMVSGPERLLPVFRFHTNLPAMKTREPSKVRIPSLITGPEYPFSTQSETFLIASLAERSINTMPPAIAAT